MQIGYRVYRGHNFFDIGETPQDKVVSPYCFEVKDISYIAIIAIPSCSQFTGLFKEIANQALSAIYQPTATSIFCQKFDLYILGLGTDPQRIHPPSCQRAYHRIQDLIQTVINPREHPDLRFIERLKNRAPLQTSYLELPENRFKYNALTKF